MDRTNDAKPVGIGSSGEMNAPPTSSDEAFNSMMSLRSGIGSSGPMIASSTERSRSGMGSSGEMNAPPVSVESTVTELLLLRCLREPGGNAGGGSRLLLLSSLIPVRLHPKWLRDYLPAYSNISQVNADKQMARPIAR